MADLRGTQTIRISICTVVCIACLFASPLANSLLAYSAPQRRAFQRSIIDHRGKLNPRFKKINRRQTKYIIVHTSETNFKGTLRTISRGKRLHNGRRTYGGHANYVIARDGRTFRTLDKKYRADHAGRSMWSGETDISSVSVGIELVGYHYTPITDSQYRSVGILIDILKRVYHLEDRDVLTHSQVAYGKPNRWFKNNHRGRKRCAKNFIRTRAGLGPTWAYDPDVRAGRLGTDPQLAGIFYGKKTASGSADFTNVISKTNTAWAIAGEDYNSHTTVYKFPGGRVFRGDQISTSVGWDRLQAKTVVLLNQESTQGLSGQSNPVKTITNGLSAWSFAGAEYNHQSTIYFLPGGAIKDGRSISDWDDLPEKTRLIVGYRGPFKISGKKYAYQIAGSKYKDRNTLYYFPSKTLIAGNEIKDFSTLPKGTLVFVPIS